MAFAAAGWFLRNKRAGKAACGIAVLFGSVLIATALACGLQFSEPRGAMLEHIQKGLLTAIPWFAAALCTLRLCDLRKQDKGL